MGPRELGEKLGSRGWRVGLIVSLLCVAIPNASQQPAGTWLDKPPARWNTAGAAPPSAPRGQEPSGAIFKRCQLEERRTTAAEKALASGGWLTFLPFDREFRRDDIEIIGGMAAADAMCRPLVFNFFVFVEGRFAGTLAPQPMNSQADGSAGALRILDADTLSVEFARYLAADALCCPSSRVAVTFRIDRNPKGPTVMPTAVRTLR